MSTLYQLLMQQTKHQLNTILYLAMSTFGACLYLSGKSNGNVDVKSFAELNEIGVSAQHLQLLHLNFVNEMSCFFWMRDFVTVVDLTAKPLFSKVHKRVLQVVRVFFEGVACVTLARQTRQPKWKQTAEDALETLRRWERISKWNFVTMRSILEAELHYLNGDLESADTAYEASIVFSREYKFLHYEGLAYELHGIFLLENNMLDKATGQLRMALNKYRRWGATKKVEELQSFMELVNPTYLREELRINI